MMDGSPPFGCNSKALPMRRRSDPYLQVKVNIPFDVNARLEQALWDPLLKKPRYGGRSELITALLREWLARQEGQGTPMEGTSPND